MANPNFEIDWAPPSIAPGVANLLTVLKSNREQARADSAESRAAEMLKQNNERVKLEERRLSAEEFRRQQDFESRRAKERRDAYLSAIAYEKNGDPLTAKSIRMQHEIAEEPVMSEPQVFTPAQALAQSPKAEQGPVAFGAPPTQTRAPVTPLTALRGSGTGTTVPEEQPPPTVVPPPDVTTGVSAPNAVSDLEPMSVDPAPTGAKRFYGPSGQLIGEYDPAQERAFREERAGRVSEALGPMGENFAKIAQLVAAGDMSEAEGRAMIAMLGSQSLATQKASEKVAEREDQQKFNAEQNAQFKRTFDQEKELTRIRAAQAGGGGSSTVDAAAAQLQTEIDSRLKSDAPMTPGEIKKRGVELGIPLNPTKNVKTSVEGILNDTIKDQAADRAASGVAVKGSEKRIDFDAGIRSLNTMIAQLEKNPAAWDAYRKNMIDWERNKGVRESGLGKAGQFFGIANLRPEQGLEGNSEALTLFQRQQRLDTAIAKGFGGVITQGDRDAASSNQANFALNAQQKLAQLKEYRDDKMAGFRVATGTDWAPAKPGDGSHPSKSPVGQTRVGPDGKTYRKVGPNNWQPVTQ